MLILIIVLAAVWAFITYHPVFGGMPDAESMKRILASKAYNARLGKFENQEPTQLLTSNEKPSLTRWIIQMFRPEHGKNPSQPLPTVKINTAALKNGSMA